MRKDAQGWGLAGCRAPAAAHHVPEALAVVELALGQVALHQVDVLLAGGAGTAERGALRRLRRLRGDIVLRGDARGAQRGGHEVLTTSPWLLQSSCCPCYARCQELVARGLTSGSSNVPNSCPQVRAQAGCLCPN